MVNYIEANLVDYLHGFASITAKLSTALLVVILSYLAARMVKRAIRKWSYKTDWLDETLLPVVSDLAKYFVYAIGLLISLDILGVNTNSIIAVLGAAGIAVGLALKDTLSNVASGLMLIMLRPFKVDDVVEFSSVSGRVKEIHLFNTTLETHDGHEVYAPNSVIWSSSIKNFTSTGKRRLDINVGISYSDSIDKAFDVLRKIALEEDRLLNDPEPLFLVISLAESSVDLQLRAWTHSDDYWSAYYDLNKIVKEKIEKAGLTIPFPQRDLHIKSGNI